MANEITLIRAEGRDLTVLFLFPIPPVSQITNGFTGTLVVPTPSATLDPAVAALFTAGEKTALDNGSGVYEIHTPFAAPGLTAGQIATRVREMYAAREAVYLDEYRARFQFWPRLGTRLNK